MHLSTKKTLCLLGSGMLFTAGLACRTVPSPVEAPATPALSSPRTQTAALEASAQAESGAEATLPVVVKNHCPFPLHVLLSGEKDVPLEKDGAGKPRYQELAPRAAYTYHPPSHYPSGRVSAYKTPPSPTSPRELEKTEFTLDGNIHYNLTYVDHLGLPMRISATGTGAGCKTVQCNRSHASVASSIASSCPDGLRYPLGGDTVCLAPRSFCLDGEHAKDPRWAEVCSRLDSEVARCAKKYPGQCNPGADKTPQVYACTGSFTNNPKWCAALTRGMLDSPDSTAVDQYYNTGKPHSRYARWVHEQCGAVYGFPYDDYPQSAGQAGFFTCTGGKQLEVTFCPMG